MQGKSVPEFLLSQNFTVNIGIAFTVVGRWSALEERAFF